MCSMLQRMEQGLWGTEGRGGEQADPAPLTDVLAFLEASVETLCAVDWAEHDAEALANAVGRVEVVARRVHSVGRTYVTTWN